MNQAFFAKQLLEERLPEDDKVKRNNDRILKSLEDINLKLLASKRRRDP